MKFCCAQHRKAFDYEGETPIGNILRRQEKHMRQIAQEEAEAAIERHYHYANGEQTGEGLLGMPEQ